MRKGIVRVITALRRNRITVLKVVAYALILVCAVTDLGQMKVFRFVISGMAVLVTIIIVLSFRKIRRRIEGEVAFTIAVLWVLAILSYVVSVVDSG